MAQMKKVNWPLAYIITGTIDTLQLCADLIPFIDLGAIVANDGPVDIAVGAGIAWWAKRNGLLDLGSGAAILVTFGIEEVTGGSAPFWIGDIAILHLKYKAKEKIANAEALMNSFGDRGGPANASGRREPTGGPIPVNQGGTRQPM
jgi:hypothetical protein